ncbi:MAG: fibronectin type III domain-containing protein [Bacteroidia bacterium]
MKTVLKIALLIIYNLTFISYSSQAQTYPVQLSTSLIPPYSGYLADYADPSSEKLKVILQFNDFTVPQYNVRLKFEIKGNGFTLSTKQFYNPPPLQIEPGVPFMLSGSDIAPYLNSSNLDFVGINQSQYEQHMALPEGYYSICVKAYDYYNSGNVQVSNEACAQAWFTLSDPPFLNLPLCNAAVTPQTPQNLLFQWTPMNLGSPNSALNTEYLFELWECRPDTNANPNQIVQSTPPIYSTTTQQTLLNYGLTEPPLNLYMKYVWRVKAQDVSGRDLFKNNGYSQICTFNYGSVAGVLGNALSLNLSAQAVTHRLGKCTWNTQSVYSSYKLQVRKKGTVNWFDYNTTQNSEKVTNLEPNTEYEAQVQGIGNGITSAWSNIASFTTNNEPNYNCNDQTQLADPLQAQPLPINKAIAGLIIQSGQFEVVTTQIAPTGAPGWYSGKGYAKVFGLLPLAVKWDNIYIDDNNRHQQGVIEALTKGIDKWVQQYNDNNEYVYDDSYVYNGCVDSIYVNSNNQVVIQDCNGQTTTIPNDTNGGLLITDSNGNQWVVNSNGTVTPVSNVVLPLTAEPLTADELDIMKKALGIIKVQYSNAVVNAAKQQMNDKSSELDNFINSQRQQYTTNTQNNIIINSSTEYIGYSKIDNLNGSGIQKSRDFKQKEFEYNVARILYIFSREENTNTEFNFIGKYLSVSGKEYKTFVAEEKAKNRSHIDIANDVAQLGIKPLGETAAKRKMKLD